MPNLPIVGARFRPPAQEVLDNLPAGAKLLLRRQPDNPYDGNAVQVMLDEAFSGNNTAVFQLLRANECTLPLHLGFIPREAAAKLAPLMDEWERLNIEAEEDVISVEWPATLTFSPSGGPMITFEEPSNA